MSESELRNAADEWVRASRERLSKWPVCAGANFIIGDGELLEFSMWANDFSVAFYRYLTKKDDGFWPTYSHAAEKYSRTIWRAAERQEGEK